MIPSIERGTHQLKPAYICVSGNLHWLMTPSTSSTKHILENPWLVVQHLFTFWFTTSQDIDTDNDTAVL